MKNEASVPTALGLRGGPLRSSEPVGLGPPPSVLRSLLEEAADYLVVHRDFGACLETCQRGCEKLGSPGQAAEGEDSKDLKCFLCVVGIQALAEMDRWREVLSWLLQYYPHPEHLPPKILELCILLYSKVKEPQAILEVASSWLREPANRDLPEYGAIFELHLFRVLLPLHCWTAAEDMTALCAKEEQRQAASQAIATARQQQEESLQKTQEPQRENQGGTFCRKLLALWKLLRWLLESVVDHVLSLPLKKTILIALILCLLMVRFDPACPSSLPFFYKLAHIFYRIRGTIFSPCYLSSYNS
ncbi:peroxisome assembly protein 26 [Sarcophilus harrisii]|uniref:peroxisome assembly protein 26 n=1 Tax=Sarcophilus harrisii TaxID=9305 RepID=UPI0013020B83|nr:peroxisome assembly protein 26 [Sarcophilus harrisii]XP_023360416.2 peroxisome assembly protein 26 [Sarcophilus harrisii]XP_031795580.1 peroxisome assembly protein 26 [Sarcophilus harrisii]